MFLGAFLMVADADRGSRCAAEVVVLHRGNVLLGAVTEVGDGYEVAGQGSVLHVRGQDVAFVAESLVDAYDQQRRLVQPANAVAHLKLARWCIRYRLWQQAAREIVDARGHDADHPAIEFVERQLAVASGGAAASAADEPVISPVAMQVEEPPAEESPAENLADDPSKDLPDGALEQFARRVQPVLVNNCTAAGCHREDGPTKFQLNRAFLHGEGNRDSTLRNLTATLANVDFKQPTRSPLLRMSLRAHGGLDEAVFPPYRRALYEQVADWVAQVAKAENAKLQTELPPPRIAIPQPTSAGQTRIQRGVIGARPTTAARGRYRSPHLRYGVQLRKVEDDELTSDEELVSE